MNLWKHQLLRGTLVLTIAGVVTRMIGFLYKIYLADLLGPRQLGLYQLIFPFYGICFTLYGAGIQTALSQVIATKRAKSKEAKELYRTLRHGFRYSLIVAFSLFFLVQMHAEWIAETMLFEPELAPELRILSCLFPFCGMSACMNGYYYGFGRTSIPAVTQIVEQLVRVSLVCLVGIFCSLASPEKLYLTVWGLVAGEVGSNLYITTRLFLEYRVQRRQGTKERIPQPATAVTEKAQGLLWLTSTLTATRLILALLHSVEAILLPEALRAFGYSRSQSLSMFGILFGMSLSFLLFPSTLTNSLAVMLLPSVADSHARKNEVRLEHTIMITSKYSILTGILFTGIFLLFGKEMGLLFFHNAQAGSYLFILSWLCPFLYLSTTLSSVINGLGKTQLTFFYTVLSMVVKLGFLILGVPRYGIRAYLIGLLFSQLLQTLLEYGYLRKYLALDALKWIAVPSGVLLLFGSMIKGSYCQLTKNCLNTITTIGYLTLCCIVCCGVYFLCLKTLHVIDRSDLMP